MKTRFSRLYLLVLEEDISFPWICSNAPVVEVCSNRYLTSSTGSPRPLPLNISSEKFSLFSKCTLQYISKALIININNYENSEISLTLSYRQVPLACRTFLSLTTLSDFSVYDFSLSCLVWLVFFYFLLSACFPYS